MKIKFWPYDLSLAHPWAIASRKAARSHPVVLVELTDDEGVVGLGEAAPSRVYGETPAGVLAFCERVDARQLSFADLPGSMNHVLGVAPGEKSAHCAFNLALLDGAAQRARQPLHDYFGLGFQDNHHRTSFSIGLDTPEVIRQKVLSAVDYPVLKLKVGAERDQENLAALRAVAPTKLVRLDANEGWATKEQALQMIEQLAQAGPIEFIEQPMPRETPPADWAWLKARSPLPLFADESYRNAGDLARCVGGFHGVNVKLVKTGGASAAFEALRAARQAGLQTMIGCMIETSVLISAAAHLAELADYLDLDGNLLTTNDPFSGVTAAKGMLSFASAPGKFGLRVAAKI